MARAFLFPGQGSQFVGMGKALHDAFPGAREVFEEVDDALETRLSRIMFEGPEEELRLTENTQPALMAVSIAALRVLEDAGVETPRDAQFIAGHSLGEYSGLAAARSLSLAETARLLRLRGGAMQRAVPVGEGAMAALLGLDFAAAKEICDAVSEDGDLCVPANDNAAGQVVISGHKDAVDRAMDAAKEKGAKRALPLPVSAPFHSPLMQPAADEMEAALAGAQIADPMVPIVANVTASSVTDAEDIRRLLVEQVTGVVRWRESMDYLLTQDIDTVVEIGAGKVLSGLAKRASRDLKTHTVGEPEDIDAFIKTL